MVMEFLMDNPINNINVINFIGIGDYYEKCKTCYI